MTDSEYAEFSRDVLATFPRLSKWLDEECPQTAIKGVKARWRETWTKHDLVDARAAIDQLYRNPEQLERKRLDSWVPIMAAETGRIGAKRKFSDLDAPPRYIDGEQVYRCYECRDYGARIVWSETSKRVARGEVSVRQDGKPQKLGDQFTLYSMAVACTCEAGGHWTNPKREPPLILFNPDYHLPVLDMADPTEQAALIEFVRPKGHPAFAAFAGGQEG